jgi:uncharacterized protein
VHIDPAVAVAGLIVGFTVGLTGMGGGALMTPILVLLFKVQPLAAVSSDLVASVIMKPVGGGVHLRRGTVNFALVRWLMVGSVPAAFAGVLVLRALGDGAIVQARVEQALGVALVVAASSIAAKALLQFRAARRAASDPRAEGAGDRREVRVRPLPTVLVGVAGGLVVGMTSVGSGSLMIVLLMLLYPMLRSSELVGTDLVQAVPLVGSAALGHVLFGDFKLDLTASLLVGCLRRRQGLLQGPRRGDPPGPGDHPAGLGAQAARPRHPAARRGGDRGGAAGGAAVGRARRHQPARPGLDRREGEPPRGGRRAVRRRALRGRLRGRAALFRSGAAEAGGSDRPAAPAAPATLRDVDWRLPASQLCGQPSRPHPGPEGIVAFRAEARSSQSRPGGTRAQHR